VETTGPAQPSDVDERPANDFVSPSLQPGTVLYIEDNLDSIEVVESIFKKRCPNIKLIATTVGEPAVDLVREHAPEVVLLDLDLPDSNGIEVLRRLKLDVNTRYIPVLIVSADVVPAQIERMLDAGAYDYVTKPINVRRLLELIDSALKAPIPVGAGKLVGRPRVTVAPS
jgi:CheY-like chemotaxis protein